MGRSAKSVEWFLRGRWRAYSQAGSSSCPFLLLCFVAISEMVMHVAGGRENQSQSGSC